MRQAMHEVTIATTGRKLYEFTEDVRQFVRDSGIATGLLTIFCRHTSASLTIQENADPDVQRDLVAFFKRLVPDGDALFVHRSEGPDDMSAHVKSALTDVSLCVPVRDGKPVLGTWQGIYLIEHRTAPHHRHIALQIIGE